MSTSYVINASNFPKLAKLVENANILTADDRIHLVVGETVGNLGRWRCGSTEENTRLVAIYDGSEIETMPGETVTLSLSSGIAVVSERKHMGSRESAVVVVNEADVDELLGR